MHGSMVAMGAAHDHEAIVVGRGGYVVVYCFCWEVAGCGVAPHRQGDYFLSVVRLRRRVGRSRIKINCSHLTLYVIPNHLLCPAFAPDKKVIAGPSYCTLLIILHDVAKVMLGSPKAT